MIPVIQMLPVEGKFGNLEAIPSLMPFKIAFRYSGESALKWIPGVWL
jgi:hypothetical protein